MSFIKKIFTIGLSTFLNMLLSLLTTPIITRIVDPAEYGKFSMFTTHTGVIASFCYFGLNEALLRFFYSYKEKKEQSGLLKLCFLIPLFSSFLLSVFALIFFQIGWIQNEYEFFEFFLLFVNVVLAVCNYISTEMLQNTQNSKMYSLATMSQRFVYCGLALAGILFLKKNYLLILIFSTILSVLSSFLIGVISTKEYWNFRDVPFVTNQKEVLSYSLPISIYFVIYSIYDTADKLLVDKYCTKYDVGIYTSAFAIIGIFAIVQTAFTVMWRPIQTEHYTLHPDDTSFLSKGNRYMTIIMFFVGIHIILFKDLLCLLLGEKYRLGATILPFLIFNPIMNTLISTVTSGIEKMNKSISRVIIIVISFIVLWFGCVLLIPKIGAKGAAISVAVSLTIQYFLTVYYSNKYYQVDYGTKKVLILTLVTMAYAYVNTFYPVGVIHILLYLLSLGTIVILYKEDLKAIYLYVKDFLKK